MDCYKIFIRNVFSYKLLFCVRLHFDYILYHLVIYRRRCVSKNIHDYQKRRLEIRRQSATMNHMKDQLLVIGI
jgi:hypothetical protein